MIWRARDCSWLTTNNQDFQNLRPNDFKCASDPETNYNCIAWAAGRTDKRWWPTETAPYFWPPGLPKRPPHKAETLENFIRVFERDGYKVCWTSWYSTRYEKIAIYVGKNGRPTHAARRLPNKMWSSKLGKEEDIEHRNLRCIEGKLYGRVKVILKRKWLESQKLKERIFH